MNWIALEDMLQLEEIDERSETSAQIIFKHSTRCNISADAYTILNQCVLDMYFLDLLAHRDISNEIADRYEVMHKSPQILVIKNGKCIYHESHWHIKCAALKAVLDQA